jgi:hypothetical protein
MKTRNGFVSNSSTTSHVCIVSREEHERILRELHPFVAELLQSLGGEAGEFKTIQLHGMDMVFLSWWGGNRSSIECARYDISQKSMDAYIQYLDWTDSDNPGYESHACYEALESYTDRVEKSGGFVSDMSDS